jgi:hypothetical protein
MGFKTKTRKKYVVAALHGHNLSGGAGFRTSERFCHAGLRSGIQPFYAPNTERSAPNFICFPVDRQGSACYCRMKFPLQKKEYNRSFTYRNVHEHNQGQKPGCQ